MKDVNVCFLFSLILPLSFVIASPFPQTSDQDAELPVIVATEPSFTEGNLQVSPNPDEQLQTETKLALTGSGVDEPLTSDEIDFIADSNIDPNAVDSTQSGGDTYLLNPGSSDSLEGFQIAQAAEGALDRLNLRCPRGLNSVCANDGRDVTAKTRVKAINYESDPTDKLCQDIQKIGCCSALTGEEVLRHHRPDSPYTQRYLRSVGWTSGDLAEGCGASPISLEEYMNSAPDQDPLKPDDFPPPADSRPPERSNHNSPDEGIPPEILRPNNPRPKPPSHLHGP